MSTDLGFPKLVLGGFPNILYRCIHGLEVATTWWPFSCIYYWKHINNFVWLQEEKNSSWECDQRTLYIYCILTFHLPPHESSPSRKWSFVHGWSPIRYYLSSKGLYKRKKILLHIYNWNSILQLYQKSRSIKANQLSNWKQRPLVVAAFPKQNVSTLKFRRMMNMYPDSFYTE